MKSLRNIQKRIRFNTLKHYSFAYLDDNPHLLFEDLTVKKRDKYKW